MNVHVCSIGDERDHGTLCYKVKSLGHTLVANGDGADVVLVVVNFNNYRDAMNWIPVLWDLKPTTPIIFFEGDYPNRIHGSLTMESSPEELDRAIHSVVTE